MGSMGRLRTAAADVLDGKLQQSFRLKSGRRLGFAEYGQTDGDPFFYFHGWPSSRLEVKLGNEIFHEVGARIIAIDRPGYGFSEFLPERTLNDWPDDVCQLADSLGFEKFGVIGTSGGGPYAAVCARFLPHRLTHTLLICPLSPLTGQGATNGMRRINRVMVKLATRTPRVALLLSGLCLEYVRRMDCAVFPPQLEGSLAAADRLALAQPDFRNLLIESTREAFRQGVRGPNWDAYLYSRPWGFELEDIATPVCLWHGESDRIVPVCNGKCYATAVPQCRAFFFPEDGHFSLPFTRIREIISLARN
jgi:pimeloyl-ACP methyl ester carboxylesterase